jgi:hypothetical protein
MNFSHVVSHVVSAVEPFSALRANERTGRDMLGTNMALQQSFSGEESTTALPGAMERSPVSASKDCGQKEEISNGRSYAK